MNVAAHLHHLQTVEVFLKRGMSDYRSMLLAILIPHDNVSFVLVCNDVDALSKSLYRGDFLTLKVVRTFYYFLMLI